MSSVLRISPLLVPRFSRFPRSFSRSVGISRIPRRRSSHSSACSSSSPSSPPRPSSNSVAAAASPAAPAPPASSAVGAPGGEKGQGVGAKNALEWVTRTALCGELGEADVGRRVRLCGWVALHRVHGGLTFLNLRDHSGIVQASIYFVFDRFTFLL